MKSNTSLLVFLLLSLLACSPPEVSVPVGIIPRDSMVMIMTDIHIAEAALQLRDLGRNDTLRLEAYGRYRYIFEKYGVTRARFNESFTWYSNNPHLFHEMYEQVIDRLNVMQAKGLME